MRLQLRLVKRRADEASHEIGDEQGVSRLRGSGDYPRLQSRFAMGAPSIVHASLPSKDRMLVPKRLRIPAKLEAVLDDHGSGNAEVVLLQRRCPAPVRPACRLDSEKSAFK